MSKMSLGEKEQEFLEALRVTRRCSCAKAYTIMKHVSTDYCICVHSGCC